MRKSIVDQISNFDNPQLRHKNFYVEHFLSDPVEIPKCVHEELGFGSFAAEGVGESLRSPRLDTQGMKEAKQIIGNTMPVHYGEPSGMSLSYATRCIC